MLSFFKRKSRPAYRIDVIVPAYNPGSLLEAALESCLAQTYRNFTITVIDDCSTEDIPNTLQRFPDVNYLRNEKNSGPAYSRNAGIKATQGDLVSFLDADDLWSPTKLERAVETFARDGTLGMVCGNYEIDVDGRRKAFFRKREKINHASLVKRNCVATGSVTVRRDVLKEVGIFNETLWIAEDYDLWLRISERYPIRYVHEVMYYYRTTGRASALTERPEVQARHHENVERIVRESYERLNKGAGAVLLPGSSR